MDARHAGTTRYANAAGRRGREFAEIAFVAGPMAGQYLARQDWIAARRAESAQLCSVWDGEVDRGAVRSVLARLREAAGVGLMRAGEHLRGSRRVAPPATRTIPAGPAR
jgi:hypothetical protein